MALNAALRLQVRLSILLLLALLQAAGQAPVEGATASRRAMTATGLSQLHITAPHHLVSQARSRALLDRAEAPVIKGGSSDGSRSGNSSNMTSSAGIVAGVFLGLTLLGTVAGCMLVRMCAGTPIEVVASDPVAVEGQKGDKAQEIPVLTGLRISQPDGTFVCAIDSAPSADLELRGGGRCCTAACSKEDADQLWCKGCGCGAAFKV